MRKQKGITLIALILTVVVIMILAAVIITSIKGDRIIEQANAAKTKYSDEATKENSVISDYMDLLDSFVPQQGEYPITFYLNGDSSITKENLKDSNYDNYIKFTLLAPSGNKNNGKLEIWSYDSEILDENQRIGEYTLDETGNFTFTAIRDAGTISESIETSSGKIKNLNGSKALVVSVGSGESIILSDTPITESEKVLNGTYAANFEGTEYTIIFNENNCTVNVGNGDMPGTYKVYDDIVICTVNYDNGSGYTKTSDMICEATYEGENIISLKVNDGEGSTIDFIKQ